jgi:Uncharacterized protein conserved in bacteria (DUF2325)
MAFNLAHMLSTSGLQAVPPVPRPVRPELIVKDATDPQGSRLDGSEPDGMAAATPRRTRIWEFGTNLHCSIVGTCLSTAELRHVVDKLKISGAATASDHELHSVGVMLAGHREGGARFLQKALDRRHRSAIARCASAKETADLLALWEESLRQGDIPGAYWAVLTHPMTTEAVVKRVFGDVHMLSHLVGAANRADIRRLRQLEQENAALLAKIERQQRQLRDGFAVRDQSIRRLNEMLLQQDGKQPDQSDSRERPDDIETADNLIRDLQKRLAREIASGDRMARRFNEASALSSAKDRTLQRLKEELEATQHELALVESHLDEVVGQPRPDPEMVLNLSGITLLYVGGRANQIPRLKALVERAGARFLHHDGGLEQNVGLLPSLVSRADHVTFPVDCVSHDAAAMIKRLCRQTGRPYQPLRSASLACLLSVLPAISHRPTENVVSVSSS